MIEEMLDAYEMRSILLEMRRDWLNNYTSVAGYAERNGLTMAEAQALIVLCRAVKSHNHPEA